MLSGSSFEHNESNEVVNDAERNDLLANIVRGLYGENFHFYCCLEIVDICLDRPTPKIQLCNFFAWILIVVEQSGDNCDDRRTIAFFFRETTSWYRGLVQELSGLGMN